ncbi:MAG: OsmC family protein [Candidatus Magnetoovum sp. WYHC-5]|nr:OsmC family protein [Candidatus Magnetoovum sp. WYHC-5]
MDAKVKFVEGMQFVGYASSGHAIVMDGDHEVGGNDTGSRPSELLLIAIGGCTGMDVISILRKKKQDVTSFEINVHGDKAGNHPKKFETMTLEYVFKGHNLSEEAVKRACELSFEKYCTVRASLAPGVNITYTYKIIEDVENTAL